MVCDELQQNLGHNCSVCFKARLACSGKAAAPSITNPWSLSVQLRGVRFVMVSKPMSIRIIYLLSESCQQGRNWLREGHGLGVILYFVDRRTSCPPITVMPPRNWSNHSFDGSLQITPQHVFFFACPSTLYVCCMSRPIILYWPGRMALFCSEAQVWNGQFTTRRDRKLSVIVVEFL